MAKEVLFVSHDASRTGAPILLLQLLKWLKRNTDLSFEILIKTSVGNRAELIPEFAALAEVAPWDKLAAYPHTMAGRAIRKMGFDEGSRQAYFNRLKKKRAEGDLALVYANTAANGQVLEWLAKLHVPTVTHVHELQYAISHSIGTEPFKRVLEHSDHFIAVSEAVRKNLIENHGVRASQIDLVHGFIGTQQLKAEHHNRSEFLQQLGLSEDSLLVGGAGSVHWRKGADLFIQLARVVRNRMPSAPIFFVWIGGPTEGLYFRQVSHDIAQMGLDKSVRFLGEVPDPADYIAAMDVFALTSREDPFPLVCLEAAALSKPIVCFDGAGGAKEFVEDDCGFIVPYLDIHAMAKRIGALLNMPDLRKQFGARAAEKVTERHDVEVTAPRILEIVQRFL
jgi:glycosyltransferase involved in cell wall biosynthesis